MMRWGTRIANNNKPNIDFTRKREGLWVAFYKDYVILGNI